MSIFASMRYCLGDPSDHGNLWAALAFMPFGLFFDFMDGKVARWRKKSSLMGQELDSLADLVCASNPYHTIPCPTIPYPIMAFLLLSPTFYYRSAERTRSEANAGLRRRSPSASPPPPQPSPSASAPQPTTSS